MSTLLPRVCLRGIAAADVALLPPRWQIAPGVGRLAGAAVLAGRLAQAGPALLAVVSMCRTPLRYLLRRAVTRRDEAAG
jgi:ethanolamine utilization microcompartment shell protein EutS